MQAYHRMFSITLDYGRLGECFLSIAYCSEWSVVYYASFTTYPSRRCHALFSVLFEIEYGPFFIGTTAVDMSGGPLSLINPGGLDLSYFKMGFPTGVLSHPHWRQVLS